MDPILNSLATIPWYGWIGLASVIAGAIVTLARIKSGSDGR